MGLFLAVCCYQLYNTVFLFGEAATTPSKIFQDQVAQFCANAPANTNALVFCTSQGAIIAKNALKDMPEEYRNRLDMRSIAPAAYIPREFCRSIRNYAAARDLIPMIDMKGRRKYADTLQIVPSHPTAPFFDHSFSSRTFESYIKYEIEQYKSAIGN